MSGPDFVPREGDVIIKEHWAQSGFANTDLDQQLKTARHRESHCYRFAGGIESTGRFAMELGYHVTLVKDATAAFKREMMRAAHELNGPTFAHAILTTEELIAALPTTSSPLLTADSKVPAGFTERFAEVNGVRLHYLIGGKGSPVVLLHGYAQTSHMWHPIMPLLAKNHTVIVPDLRGAGGSSKPESGYDKKNMAVDIHELISSLGFDRVSIVGHDIGLMVAYAYAAQFPQETERVVLMDAFLPGIGNWKDVWLMRDLWHFHFYGEVPLALVKGRERTYFEHFWNDFAADPKHSVPEADRRIYAKGLRAAGRHARRFRILPQFRAGRAGLRRSWAQRLLTCRCWC